jgi:type I restriction enzyme M protein
VLKGSAKKDTSVNLRLEAKIWAAAHALRHNMDPEYKHVVLGLIFLKHISDYVLADAPFNDSESCGELLKDDPRGVFAAPTQGSANLEWAQTP